MDIAEIKEYCGDNLKQEEYATNYKRGYAFVIDMVIVFILRVVANTFLWFLWFGGKINVVREQFIERFGQGSINMRNPEHLRFLYESGVFTVYIKLAFLLFLVGSVYNIALTSSSWQATVGKRVLGIYVRKIDGSSVTIGAAILRYVASLLPWFMPVVIFYLYKMGYTAFLLPIVVIWSFWYETSVFSKKKRTIHDFIASTVVVKGRVF